MIFDQYAHLKAATEKQKACYKPPYNRTTSDTEALGELIARHLDWDIDLIVELCAAALTEANAHTLAKQLQTLNQTANH